MVITSQARLVESLRTDLASADFTVSGVESALGSLATAAMRRGQLLPARWALHGDTSALATLIRVLMLGGAARRADLDAALPRLTTAGTERLALVAAAGEEGHDEVRALVDLRPYAVTDAYGDADWWLASDLGEEVLGRDLRTDHVLGAGGASLTLAQLTVRRKTGRVLDLGTGCGLQALHATRHAEHVVGTDLSARALAFARFNAALAGVDLELRSGSMLEPVAGESFDQVVSNPPFVITPRAPGAVPDYEYRDGGRSGDVLVADLVAHVGSVLAPGGTVQMLGNWEHHDGEDWRERVGSWLEASGLDGWVVQREVLDPAEYAETWIRDGGTTPERDLAAWNRAYRAWLDDFADRGVSGVGMGFLVLRRPVEGDGSPRWHRCEERTAPLPMPIGSAIADTLAAHDWLAGHDDDALAATHLQVAPDVTDERYLTPGASDPNVVLLRQGGGLGRSVHASSELAALVGACDGELSVGQIVAALGSLTGTPTARLQEQLFPAVRDLLLDGFLLLEHATPPGPASPAG